MKVRPPLLFAIVTTLAAVGAIVAGIAVIGSPTQIRERRLDSQRVQHLQSLSNTITNYRRTHDSVPDALEKLEQPSVHVGPWLKDPATGEPFDYRAKDASTYEICATFQLASADNPEAIPSDFWWHERGRKCFTVEARLPVRR